MLFCSLRGFREAARIVFQEIGSPTRPPERFFLLAGLTKVRLIVFSRLRDPRQPA